jgi:kinesin family protein 4/21/27
MTEMVGNYISEIEQLKAKLIESEQMFQQLKKSQTSPPKNALKSSVSYMSGGFSFLFS